MKLNELERLVAVEAIKAVKARRCRALDAKDWDAYRDCHTVDARSYVLSGGADPLVGRDALTDSVRKSTEGKATLHHVFMPEFEFTSATSANVIWVLEDRLWWDEDGLRHWVHGFGRYYETYEQVGERWLISSRRLVRSRVDTGVGQEPGD